MKISFEGPKKSRPGYDFSIRNAGVFEDIKIEKVKLLFEDVSKKELEEISLNSQSVIEVFGEEVKKPIEDIYLILNRYFSVLGIEGVQVRDVFYSKINTEKVKGISDNISIRMYDLNIEDKNLKMLVWLKTLIHEMYHSVAKVSLDLQKKTDPKTQKNKLLTKKDRFGNVFTKGASYGGKDGALEEGLAVVFEKEVFEKIQKCFSEKTLNKYYGFIKKISQQDALASEEERLEGRYISLLSLTGDSGSGSFTEGYFYSGKMAEFLIQEVPDFLRLVEEARISRKTLGLARAIEDRFGKGMYRKLTTIKTKEARSFLEKLRESK